jgi:Bacterial tandem repeat domain 1
MRTHLISGTLRRGALAALAALAFAAPTSAQTLFTGVWRAGNDGHFLWSGVEWSAFTAKWQELAGQNLRLEDIETYVEGGRRKYTGVWRAGTDGHFLWAGVSWSDFTAKWEELARQNLRLIDVETYEEGGQRKWIGVWRAGTDGYFLWAGVSWNDFTAKWQELAGQNLRLIDVETYMDGGQRKFAGVWRSGSDGHYLWSGVDWNNFKAKWDELGRQNLRLIDVETYEEGGQRKYTGVWRQGGDGYYLWTGVDWESFTSKWNELAGQGLRLIDLETYASPCGNCLNQVVMPTGTYNYGITSTATHCAGPSGSCGTPGAGATVVYRAPFRVDGSNRYVRHTALQHSDQFLTLPFSDTQVRRIGIWRYGNGDYHHAGDFMRQDEGTFRVLAAAPGRVVHVGWDDWSGNTIVLSHDVGGVRDAYRTIYMHLRNGADADCAAAWSRSMPTLSGQNRTDYQTHLVQTGCTQNAATRAPNAAHWGTNQETISGALLGTNVARGAVLAWAGNTGPGGKRGAGSSNTHLHIFWARKDPTDSQWYFFDPYGVYAMPTCYPANVTDAIGGCARYPVAWRNGRPAYP